MPGIAKDGGPGRAAVVYKGFGLRDLSKGCAGPEVKTIQRIINALGIDRTLGVDGSFGPQTKANAIALQKDLGTTADGIVGKDTWKRAPTAR